MHYPETRAVNVVDNYFGTKIEDPYRWLEDTTSDGVQEWINAQNRATEEILSRVALRDAFRKDVAEILDAETEYPKWKHGDRWFQFRVDPKKEQRVLYWGASEDAIDHVLLDVNAISASRGQPHALGATQISPDGRRLLYTLHRGGSDWAEAFVRDIESGVDLPDTISNLRFTIPIWSPDSRGLYYMANKTGGAITEFSAKLTGGAIQYHLLGTGGDTDRVIPGVDRPDLLLTPEISADGSTLALVGQRLDAFVPQFIFYRSIDTDAAFRVVQAPDESPLYLVGIRDGFVYFTTYYNAPNGRIVRTRLDTPDAGHWVDVVPESRQPIAPSNVNVYTRIVGDWILSVHEDFANQTLRLTRVDGSESYDVETPFAGRISAAAAGAQESPIKLDVTAAEIVFPWESAFVQRATVMHSLRTRKSRVIGEVSSPLTHSDYTSTIVWGTSRDGTRIPATLFHRRDVTPNRDRRVLFYAYGHAGLPAAHTQFKPEWAVWLKHGGVVAVIHARGGGEFGGDWHRSAIGPRKQKTFDDSIAAVEATMAQGWTRPARAAFSGRSGGGLTTAVVCTQRPDLFAACIPEVGVYDLLRYHILAGRSTEEVGTSETKTGFDTVFAYSPLHAVRREGRYPSVMITIGEFDNRVNPANSYKLAAALQATAGAHERPVLLRVDRDAGHALALRAGRLNNRTDYLSFLAMSLSMDE